MCISSVGDSYFIKVTSYILLATELFSCSYILPKNKVTIIILHIIFITLCPQLAFSCHM